MPATLSTDPPALSPRDRLLLLAVSLSVFVALEGLPWRHMFHWDRGIFLSYAVIPLLVLAALLARRRFGGAAWLVYSLEIAVAKFGLTAGVLVIVLAMTPPRTPPARAFAAAPAPVAATVPVPRPAPPTERGRVAGRLSRDGQPLPPGTLVFVSAGLPDYAWPVPTAPVTLTNDGRGLSPSLAVVQRGQPVTAASLDHALHTLVLTQAGSTWRLNVPLLASGTPTPLSLDGFTGVAQERCALHGAAERGATFVVLAHPFHQIVGADGRFAFEGVPPGRLRLTALAPDGRSSEREVDVAGGQTTSVDWSLPWS